MSRLIALTIATVVVCGCGLVPFRNRAKMGPGLQITVSVLDNVNHDHPIEVDVVMVYDKELLEELSNMPAAEWFQRRYQIENDSLGSQRLEFTGWEWAPGQLVEPINLLFTRKGRAAIIFARYLTPGEHRVLIDRHSRVQVFLGEEELEVRALE